MKKNKYGNNSDIQYMNIDQIIKETTKIETELANFFYNSFLNRLFKYKRFRMLEERLKDLETAFNNSLTND